MKNVGIKNRSLICSITILGLFSLTCGKANGSLESPQVQKKEKNNTSIKELLALPLTEKIIYSKNADLPDNAIMQGFDMDTEDNIFYSHVTDKYKVRISRGKPNSAPQDFMTLLYYGHSTNIALEKEKNDNYIWIGNFATRYPNGHYWQEQVVSRVKYSPGKTLKNFDAEDNYYIGPYKHLSPTVDVENDLLAISYADEKKRGRNCFVVYKLSEAKALPLSIIRIMELTYGNTAEDADEKIAPELQVHDLTKLKPVARFDIPNTPLSWQGFDVCKNRMYYYDGEGGPNNSIISGKAYVSVFDFDGRIIEERTEVKALSSLETLKEQEITSTGYMEAEGIKVRRGFLYLGFGSSNNGRRCAQIFKYKLAE
ncbi:hypothetical protein [Pseudopedobacter beijingensis]|uniref:Lipoprotein n=1 Tax=Pseudopedobacter beijingensis TaxID=1207056 RepID=A0ABW4IDT2_9SPHI